MKAMVAVGMAVVMVGLLSGCTQTETGTGVGVLTGGALGAIAGHNLGDGSGDRDKGALIGAAVGGLLGNQIGRTKEANTQMQQRMNYLEQKSTTRTVWIENSNGSKTAVSLSQAEGGMWIGPRGEYYDDFPAAEQLKAVYGF